MAINDAGQATSARPEAFSREPYFGRGRASHHPPSAGERSLFVKPGAATAGPWISARQSENGGVCGVFADQESNALWAGFPLYRGGMDSPQPPFIIPHTHGPRPPRPSSHGAIPEAGKRPKLTAVGYSHGVQITG